MKQHWIPAYIGLGSNMNNPGLQLSKAIKTLGSQAQVKVVSVSSFYQSRPYGDIKQDDFINAVVAVLTTLNSLDLLQLMLKIETEMGRVRNQHWGPRIIDLDLLVYSDETSDNVDLTLPHPEMSKRNFVLMPLAEIAEDIMVPGCARVSSMLENIATTNIIKLEK